MTALDGSVHSLMKSKVDKHNKTAQFRVLVPPTNPPGWVYLWLTPGPWSLVPEPLVPRSWSLGLGPLLPLPRHDQFSTFHLFIS